MLVYFTLTETDPISDNSTWKQAGSAIQHLNPSCKVTEAQEGENTLSYDHPSSPGTLDGPYAI